MTEFITESMSFVTRSLSWVLGLPTLHIEDRVVTLATGLTTPLRIHGTHSPIAIIFGHGLGPRNPRNKSHLNDDWAATLRDAKVLVPDSTLVTYTARGHGDSHGWERTAASNPAQFTWESLSGDMIAVADDLQYEKFIATGSSMGSATALFTAIKHPERVRALIMVRPPTAWESRLARRPNLMNSAAKLDQSGPYHLVLRGAAHADLPHPERDLYQYQKIVCPVLILTVEGDGAHPISTAKQLLKVIPHAELHIASNDSQAHSTWPQIIADFIGKLEPLTAAPESSESDQQTPATAAAISSAGENL